MSLKNYVIYGMFVATIIILLAMTLLATPSNNKSTFNNYLTKSNYAYVVMDTSGMPKDISKNILQCGVDFAGSLGAMKVMNVYAISKNGVCYHSVYNTTKYMCLKDIGKVISDPVIYIRYGHNTSYRDNVAYVGVDETFVQGDCSVARRPVK